MLKAFLALIVLQFAGELIADAASLPVPGMIIGLVLLLAFLAWRGRQSGRDSAIPTDLGSAAKTLHEHFGLLFVPAGVGIIAHLNLLAREGWAILAAVLISTAATIGITGLLAIGRRRAASAPDTAAPLSGATR